MSSPFNFMQALDAAIYAPFAYMSLDETPMVVAEYGTPHTELEIENVILDVQRKSMTYRLPTVQCLCIPADGSRSMLVPVMSNTMTTLASGDAFITTRDLAYMPFVNVHSEWPTLFPNENDQIIVVERFPPTSRAPSPFRFVIFMSPRQYGRPNLLLQSFFGADTLETKGSILIAKCDAYGQVYPIEATEIYFIESMVVECLLDKAYHDQVAMFTIDLDTYPNVAKD